MKTSADKAIQQINELTTEIHNALQSGDSDLAQHLTEQRLSQLQEIDFSTIDTASAEAFLKNLINENEQLIIQHKSAFDHSYLIFLIRVLNVGLCRNTWRYWNDILPAKTDFTSQT